jgi:hypothetical protein
MGCNAPKRGIAFSPAKRGQNLLADVSKSR